MPVTHALTAECLIAHLRTELFVTETLAADAPLFSSGLLDSVAMVGLIAFVEEATGADVRPSDVTLENFDTPARIADYAATLA